MLRQSVRETMKARLRRGLESPALAPANGLVLAHFLILSAFAWTTETRWLGWTVVVAFALLLYCLLRTIAIGPVTASLLNVLAVFSIFGASKLKFWLTSLRLHPYDVYVYGSWRNLVYVKDLYPDYYLYIYAGLAAIVAVSAFVFLMERAKYPSRRHVIGVGVLLLGFAGFHFAARALDGNGFGPGNRFLHFDHQHVSTFVIAGVHAFPTLLTGKYFDYGDKAVLDSTVVERLKDHSCTLPKDQPGPNIAIVLRESITIPSRVAGLGALDVDERRFASYDGRTRLLRVETHGAGSAHTLFSVLTGLSTEAFGGNKILALDLSIKNLHYSLAHQMHDCGYRTLVISGGVDGYVASSKFYKAIGFDEYYDISAVKTNAGGDYSDGAFYAFLSKKIAESSDGRPIFAYLDPIISHAPYNSPVRSEEVVPEATSARDSYTGEYIRRLIIGERDLSAFIGEQGAQAGAGKRGLVILDFGDHHPYFTKDLPGHPGFVLEDRDTDDPHLVTYFRIRSAGYNLAAIAADDPIVDTAYVSDWLVRALGWQMAGYYPARWAFVSRCKSRYWQCEQHAAAQQLHQLLRAAGVIDFR